MHQAVAPYRLPFLERTAANAAGWTAPVTVSPIGKPDLTRGAQVNSIAVNSSGRALASCDQYSYTDGGGMLHMVSDWKP